MTKMSIEIFLLWVNNILLEGFIYMDGADDKAGALMFIKLYDEVNRNGMFLNLIMSRICIQI